MPFTARVRHVDPRVEHDVDQAPAPRPWQTMPLTVQIDLDGGDFHGGTNGDATFSDSWHPVILARTPIELADAFPMIGKPTLRRPVTGTRRRTGHASDLT
jgi:hypothetical protein